MTSLLHQIRQVFLGSIPINEKRKYQIFSICIAIIHFIFMMVFYRCTEMFLFFYNIFVVLFYASMAVIMEFSERYTLIFMSAYLEIIFHSSIASFLVGFEWGFMFYTIGLIPMVFYMTYTLPYFKKSVSFPAIASMFLVLCFFMVMGLTYKRAPAATDASMVKIVDIMYFFNLMLAFLFILVMSVLFTVEIRYMQRNLERQNSALEAEANHDALTGLMNRRSMNACLKKAAEKADEEDSIFCVVMTDIDDFKKINDTYGHARGDEVLMKVAQILKDNIREEDTACRFGGEEMLILVDGDMSVSRPIAERICEEMRKTVINTDGEDINVTITIGIAEYKKGSTIREVIESADERLYHGKRNGKNRVVFE